MAQAENRDPKLEGQEQQNPAKTDNKSQTSGAPAPKDAGKQSSSKKDKDKKKKKWKNDDRKPRKRGENDVSWYIPDEQLLRDYASIPFNHPLGIALAKWRANNENPDVVANRNTGVAETIPGIMALKTTMTYGISEGATSPLNVAARKFYTYVRHANSGSRNYGSPDLMLYCMAMDNVIAAYEYMKGLYGTIAYYSPMNRYLARALVTAKHGNYDDLVANLANFRAYINTTAKKINRSLLVPSSMSFFKRHSWLFQNSFKDAPVTRSQIYTHVPTGFYKYEAVRYTTGGALCFVRVPDANFTFASLKAYVDQFLDVLLMDDDIATMAGDILKAYGDSGVFQVEDVSEDYTLQPIYSEEILGQIHNIEWSGRCSNGDDEDQFTEPVIKQAVGTTAEDIYLTSQIFALNPHHAVFQHLMDSFVDVPTPAEVVINSRNMWTGTFEERADEGAMVTSCGLDLIENGEMFWFTATGELTKSVVADSDYVAARALALIQEAQKLSRFDWAPRQILATVETGGDNPQATFYGDVWDYNNTVIVSPENIKQLHELALLGAFNVPGAASAYKG